MRDYQLSPDQRKKFQQLYLLGRMADTDAPESYSILLPGELSLLAPLLADLQAHSLVWIDTRNEYRVSELGMESLQKFQARYRDYLQMYDVYGAVDLAVGHFAYEMILQLNSTQFVFYLMQERWEDLRVAVAAYKGVDPVEIVFMSFLNEGRFKGAQKTGWCIDLVADMLWDEILRICRTALHAEDLGTEDVIQDIITQGSQLMISLLGQQHEENEAVAAPAPQAAPTPTETVTITEVETVSVPYNSAFGGYGYSTYDVGYLASPMYIAPIWYEPYWY